MSRFRVSFVLPRGRFRYHHVSTTPPHRERENPMRRWLSAQLFGAFLALMLVVAGTSTAFADPRDFTLINNTGQVITEVYVSPSNQTDWGEDVLGRDVLMP